ncbi:hypothetical protein SFA35_16365 [Pseudomonas sp. HR96]|uniref:hypothetical protein n=1 Tax=Pseudomonas sp. HR96 TaxID=1027966 RepID=UPI002A76093C|nr:hypothetical protein [Pseudomonas sp. HR96]WPO98218.1 hypothetical protein SFA35_16365 [Pseudomonas sp. HR96]
MSDYYYKGARKARRGEQTQPALRNGVAATEAGGVENADADRAEPAQGWLLWMRMQFAVATALLYRGATSKGTQPSYRVLRRVAKQVLYRLLVGLFGKVVNAGLPGVGTLLQILEEDRRAYADDQARGFIRLKRALEHFADLPSGNENEQTLRELQALVRVALSGLHLLDDYNSGAFTLGRFDDRLGDLTEALKAPYIIALTDGAALQLVEGVRYLRLFCFDMGEMKASASEGVMPEQYVAMAAKSGVMRAMVPAQLHWFVDTIGELGAIVGAFRPVMAGPGDRHAKAWQLLQLILASRLGGLLLPQLDAVVRPAVQFLLADADADAEFDETHDPLDPGSQSLAVLRWLALNLHEGLAQVQWAPEWLTRVLGYLDQLADGFALYAQSEPFPDKPLDQLAWGIELLQEARFRRLLETLFGQAAITSLTLPFEVFEQAQPPSDGSSHQMQSRWASGILERDDIMGMLASSDAGPELARSLREALAWGPLLARLSRLHGRLDEDASYAQIAHALFMELGALLVEQIRLPSNRALGKAGQYLAASVGDHQGAAVLGAYLALLNMDPQSSYADTAGQLAGYVEDNLLILAGEAAPALGEYAWLASAARRGVAIAGRWWNASSASEGASLLESAIRLIKIVFDLSPQTHAALDAIPLLPKIMEAFNDSADASGPVARLDGFVQALQDSSNPGIKQMGTKAERWLVNTLSDAMGALLPQDASLLPNLPMAAAAPSEGQDLQLSVAEQQVDLGHLSVPSPFWRSEQITMGAGVFGFATVLSLLYGGYSYRHERSGYARVGSTGQRDATPASSVLNRYRGTAMGIAAALFSACVGIGLYQWAQRRGQEEQLQRAFEEPYLPVAPQAPITLLQAVEDYLKEQSGDPLILEDSAAVERLLHELLDDSANDEYEDEAEDFDEAPDNAAASAQVLSRGIREVSEDPLTPSKAPSPRPHSRVASIKHLPTRRPKRKAKQRGVARIRLSRDKDGRVRIIPRGRQAQPGESVQPLSQTPDEMVSRLKRAVALSAYETKSIDEDLEHIGQNSGELPAELVSIEAFAAGAGSAIKQESYMMRPPLFDPDEQLEIRFKTYEDNPLLYITSPITQPYVRAHTLISPNKETDLPSSLPWYRRRLGMTGRTHVSAMEVLLGNLKKLIGDNTYGIHAIDPAQDAYLQALNNATLAEDYDRELVAHMEKHKEKMLERIEAKVYKRLNRAVGRSDYVPKQRLDQKKAFVSQVYADSVTGLKGSLGTPAILEHSLLNVVRYVDIEERIDIILFLDTGEVHDAYRPKRAKARETGEARTREGRSTSVTRIETLSQVIRSTASIGTDVFKSIAKHISKDELDHARMLRDPQGQLVYDPGFIARVEAVQADNLYRDQGPLKLKSLTEMTVADYATIQHELLQRNLKSDADARSSSQYDQEYAFWTHKAEFVGNIIATGLTIFGGLPVKGATWFARAAFLAAATTATVSLIMRRGMAESSEERIELLRRWIFALCCEVFFLTMGERFVDPFGNKLARKIANREPWRKSGLDDFLKQHPEFNNTLHRSELEKYFASFDFSLTDRTSAAVRQAFEKKLRERIKTKVNLGLLSKALFLSPYVQAAFNRVDFDQIGTAQGIASEQPLQRRDTTAGAGRGRFLPRDTLGSAAGRVTSMDWSVDEEGRSGISKLPKFADDSAENQWGMTRDLDPQMPGDYRSIGRATYRHLGSDPAKFYGNQKVRLMSDNGRWKATPIVLNAQQIEEAKRAAQQQTAATRAPTLRPATADDGAEGKIDWQIEDVSGNLRVTPWDPLPTFEAGDRWKHHLNDDPHEVGFFRRLGVAPMFISGETYQYLGKLDDRTQDKLYSLVQVQGQWKARPAPLPDRSYDPDADNHAMAASSDEAGRQMVDLQFLLHKLDNTNPRRCANRPDDWYKAAVDLRNGIAPLESRLHGDAATEARLQAFSDSQLNGAGLLKDELKSRRKLREQRRVDCAMLRSAVDNRLANRHAFIKAWDLTNKNLEIMRIDFRLRTLKDNEQQMRTRIEDMERIWEGPDGVIVFSGGESRTYAQLQEDLAENLRTQELQRLKRDGLERDIKFDDDTAPVGRS